MSFFSPPLRRHIAIKTLFGNIWRMIEKSITIPPTIHNYISRAFRNMTAAAWSTGSKPDSAAACASFAVFSF